MFTFDCFYSRYLILSRKFVHPADIGIFLCKSRASSSNKFNCSSQQTISKLKPHSFLMQTAFRFLIRGFWKAFLSPAAGLFPQFNSK